MSFAEAPQKQSGGAFWIVVGILSALAIAFLMCAGIVVAITLPAIQAARGAAQRQSCSNNMRQIGLALLNYEVMYRSLPPQYTVGPNGEKLHSWRTLILPFMEQESLYAQIDLSKPWQHPDNAAVREIIPLQYRCPSGKLPTGHTTYLGIAGKNCGFSDNASLKLSQFLDGLSNTVLVYETTPDKSVHWMDPTDGSPSEFVDSVRQTNGHAHLHGGNILFADASVKILPPDTPEKTLQGLATRDGGEAIRLE